MASQRDVTNETNARFWLTTQYKMGDALDPADPQDRRLTRIWLDIYRELLAQNAHGRLVLTHKHPAIAQNLADAIAANRIERTTRENDPRHIEASRVRNQAVNDAGMRQDMIMSRGPASVAAWPWYGGLYAVGLEGYGLPRRERAGGDTTGESIKAGYRENALQKARAIHAATGNPNIGYRDTPWGGELVVFDQLGAQERWKREQSADPDVWYAVTFRLDTYGGHPTSEVIR